MADSAGQYEIRGIDIDKLAKGFADELNVMKKYCTTSTTSAREIRWYQKTAGFLAGATTTTITSSDTLIANQPERAKPSVVQQSWTRNTSYVRKYFVASETISLEDIRDTDIDIFATLVRDLVMAVERQVDKRIYTVLTTGTGVQTGAASSVWDVAATANPIKDILVMKQAIRAYNYDPEGAILALNPIEHRNLVEYLINVKGSSIPSFSSSLAGSGVVMEILGVRVIVNSNFTTDQALLFVPQRACTWKSFVPITTGIVDEVGIGKSIRVWEEGEALLTDPKCSYLLTNTAT